MGRPDLTADGKANQEIRDQNTNHLGAPVVYPTDHNVDWQLEEARNPAYNSDMNGWTITDEEAGGEW
jgi:hypothetical protein